MSSLDIVTAAVEATKAECERRNQKELDLLKLSREKEENFELFASQIRKIQQTHAAEVQDLCQKLQVAEDRRQEAENEISGSRAALEEARGAVRTVEEAHSQQLLAMQGARDAALQEHVVDKYRLMSALRDIERKTIEEEAVLRNQLLSNIETTARSHLAVQATGDRSSIVIRKLRATVDMKQRDLDAAQRQVSTLNTKIATTIATHQKLQKEAEETNAALDQCLAAERLAVGDLTKKLAAAGEELEAFRAKMSFEAEAAAKESLKLQEQLAQSHQRVAAAEAKIVELQQQNEVLQTQHANANDLLVATAAKTKQLETTLEANNGVQEVGKKQLELAEQQLQALRQELHDALMQQQRTNALVTEKDKLIDAAQLVEAERTELKTKLDTTTAQNDTLVKDVAAANAQVSTLEEEMKKLSERLAKETKNTKAATQARQSALAELAEARDTASKTSSGVETERTARVEAEERLATLETKAREWAHQRSSLEDALSQAKDEMSKALGETIELKAANEQLGSEVLVLKGRQEAVENDALEVEAARVLQSKLSVTVQQLKSATEENKKLHEKLTLTEAHFVASETKLHHTIQDGASTTMLLDRGLKKIQASALMQADAAEMKTILSQATHTLRRALEEQGFDIAALPLAPSTNLDVPYLQQVLLDHSTLCAQHMQKIGSRNTANAAAIPSAMKTPLVYRQMEE